MEKLTLDPIGFIRTNFRVKFDAPHQPLNDQSEQSIVELLPNRGFEHALRDLETFDRVWLIWWFHKNDSWRPLVLPPRGEEKRRGVFATRSPHRPNPLGITAVPLMSVKGLRLFVGSTDLLDGTPILDIKPYLSNVDAFPDAGIGWVREIEEQLKNPPLYSVTTSALAREQIDWLKDNFAVDFFSRARTLLERDPNPHRTRRISRSKNGEFRMGCGPWRLFYTVSDMAVAVERVGCGYPKRALMSVDAVNIPDKEAQIAFGSRWENTCG